MDPLHNARRPSAAGSSIPRRPRPTGEPMDEPLDRDIPGDTDDLAEILDRLMQRQTSLEQVLDQLLDDQLDMRRSLNTGKKQPAPAESDNPLDEARIREIYDRDPLVGTAMLIKQVEQEAIDHMEDRLSELFGKQRNVGKMLKGLSEDDATSHLSAFADELEYLILERGFEPQEALALVSAIGDKQSSAGDRRAAAARSIRDRSMMETDSQSPGPVPADKELDKALKKAKNLDEMFANLRKLRM